MKIVYTFQCVVVCSLLFIASNVLAEVPASEDQNSKSRGNMAATTENLSVPYVVRKGDNLWDISEKMYNDPYKWKILWEGNKFIVDPDLIYPGDPLNFPEVEMISIPEVEEIPAEESSAKLETSEIVTHKKIKKSVTFASPDPESIPVASEKLFYTAGFIIPEDVPEGEIIASLDEKLVMGEKDFVYINIGKVDGASIGEKYTIYEVHKTVYHPVTKKRYGFLVVILGVVEIREVNNNMSLAVVLNSFSEIEVGDKLLTFEKAEIPMVDVSRKQAKDIGALILASKDVKDGLSEGDIVYIDKGVSEGVLPGDEFISYGFKGMDKVGFMLDDSEVMPKIVTGELKIIDVREETATALIVDSKQELSIGETIEYKN